MAGTEDITLRVVLDDRQAKAGLDGLRGQTAAVAAAADAGAGGMVNLSEKVGRINQVAGPAASAISGVAGAMGGMNNQAGAAVGAVANLAGAFASGGMLALGIAAVGTAVSFLTTKYQESTKAAEEAEKKQKEALEAIIKAGLSPLEAATLDLSKAQKQLELNKLLTGNDSDAILRAVTPVRMEIETLQAQINSTKGTMGALRDTLSRPLKLGESSQQYMEAREAAREEIKAQQAKLNLLEQAFRLRATEIGIVNESITLEQTLAKKKKDKEKAEKDHEKALEDSKRRMEEQLQVQEDYIRERRKIQEDAAASVGPTREMFEQELNQRAVKARQDADKARTEAEKLEAEKRKKIADDEKKAKEDALKATTANIMAATGIIVSASDQLLSDLITGQEKALERFAAAIFKQAGTVMLGKGLELGATGVANLLSGNPVQMALAGGQLAGAAGLVAGGLALGAVATGIEHTVMGASGTAATTATASSGSPTTSTPMGAGRISGSQREPGSMQEAVTYVFNAPVFGDQNRSAKHVALLQRRASRDLLLA